MTTGPDRMMVQRVHLENYVRALTWIMNTIQTAGVGGVTWYGLEEDRPSAAVVRLAMQREGISEGQGLPITPERREASNWRVYIANSQDGALDRIHDALTTGTNGAPPAPNDPMRPAVSRIERGMDAQTPVVIVTIPVLPPWAG